MTLVDMPVPVNGHGNGKASMATLAGDNEFDVASPMHKAITDSVREVVDYLDLKSRHRSLVLSRMTMPDRIVTGCVEVPVGDEIVRVFGGRVQYDNTLGAYQGGTRIAEGVDLPHVVGLACGMVIKNAAVRLGGAAKGWVAIPDGFGNRQRVEALKGYAMLLRHNMGPGRDGLGPDMGATERDMFVIQQTWGQMHEDLPDATTTTGLPVANGGIAGRATSTGYGAVYVLEEHFKRTGRTLGKGTSVALHGFGQVNTAAAMELYRRGCRIEMIADMYTGVYNPDGIDVPAAIAEVRRSGSLLEFGGGETVTGEDVLAHKCTVLILGSTENVVHEGNANRLRCEVALESGNPPITSAAEQTVIGNGVDIIPSQVASVGGVVVSFMALQQARIGRMFTESEVNSHLKETVTLAYGRAADNQDRHGLSLRKGVILDATSAIADATALLPMVAYGD